MLVCLFVCLFDWLFVSVCSFAYMALGLLRFFACARLYVRLFVFACVRCLLFFLVRSSFYLLVVLFGPSCVFLCMFAYLMR